MTHKEFAARHSHPPSPVYVNIDRQRETTDDRQPPAPIDRRTPLTYRVQLPKIDIARINALRPQPKPSANPPETASIHSEDAAESMKVDKAHMRRTLRKRKKKSYAVETAVHEPGADEPHEGFTNDELLNHQELSDKNLLFAEACGRGTRFCRPFTRANPPSNDTKVPPSIDIRSQPPSTVREKAKLDNNYQTRDEFGIFRDPESYARAIDGHALQVSREDITDILHATAQHSRAPAESCKQILQHSWSLKEISSELTIKGRYAEEAIDRCTPSAIDRYRRQASTIEDYDRSMCMPSSTRSNKDKHLLFSEDPAHLERSIGKDQRSTSIDAAAFTSTDSRTQPSTDTRPSSSTNLPRSTSIDTTPRTSIDPHSRSMVAIVILRQDENGNLYDQDGHLRNVTDDDFWQVVRHEKHGEGDFKVERSMSFGGSQWCRPMSMDTHRSTDHDEDRSTDHSRHRSTSSAESTAEPPPKPSANPPEPTSNPPDTTPEPMQVDEATEGRRLRKRKEKTPKNLKRESNEKEMDGFTKRVLRIPVEKPFDEVYFTHRIRTGLGGGNLQGSLHKEFLDIGQKEVNRAWWQPPLSLDSWKPVQSWSLKEISSQLALEVGMQTKQSIDAHPVPSIDTEEKPRRLKIMIDRCTSCTID
ncbi:hypothetical protein DY000_02016072 [Brassica cretica]|uniref:Rrn9 domain-containing protein n=1 Tax=Brassica cretica TaxID=69181 RepID=A0ABQ7DAW8_BRACR|nr:hypothetical protein DY000_02016072 [Brassica cretica]